MKYVKKKLNILLLLLLVALFTSLLGTISFASVDATEIKNWILNSYCYDYNTNTYNQDKIQDVLTFIGNHEQDINNIANASAQYNNTFLYGYDSLDGRPLGTNISYWVFDGEMYSPGDGSYIYFDQVKLRGVIRISNNTFTAYTTGGSSASGYSSTWKKYYSDTPIYNSNTYENIRYPSGTYPSGLLSSSYFTNERFTYARSELNDLINLNGSYEFSNEAEQILFVYNPFSGNQINEADSVITGYLWDADQFDYAIFSTYKYDYTTKQFRYSGDSWYSRDIGQIHDNMIWVEFKARDYGNKLIPDSLLHAEFIPKTNKFNHIHVDFYVRSPYSEIVNGVLQVDGTFSGDYALIVNSNNNTDKIINNDNSLYDKMFTIESGDIQNIIDDFTSQTGLDKYGQLNIDEEILGLLDDEPGDFIISWGNINLPNLKDNRPIKLISGDKINFSALVRSHEGLNQAMQYMRTIMAFTIIFLMLSNLWKTLMIILGVGVQLYDENEEEKHRLEEQMTTIINIDGETGEYTKTDSMWWPKARIRQNIHYKGK